MKNVKKREAFKRTCGKNKGTYVLLALAVILLLGSAIGSTRAALTYYNENYAAKITVSQIGVSLLENGDVVTRRDYVDNKWEEKSKELFEKVSSGDKDGVGGKWILNKYYKEDLAVKNSGQIDEYVRVRIYRYWVKDGKKVRDLTPDLIDLQLTNEKDWVKGPGETLECIELYHKGILEAGESSAFADKLRIKKELMTEAEVIRDGDKLITKYKYDGVEFKIEIEVDAVQTHNARDAIKSAWGVDADELGIL